MAEITATISDDTAVTSTAEQDFITTATTSTVSTTGGNLQDLQNVDTITEGLQSGSVLVYNNTTGNWVSTIILQEQDITGGQY